MSSSDIIFSSLFQPVINLFHKQLISSNIITTDVSQADFNSTFLTCMQMYASQSQAPTSSINNDDTNKPASKKQKVVSTSKPVNSTVDTTTVPNVKVVKKIPITTSATTTATTTSAPIKEVKKVVKATVQSPAVSTNNTINTVNNSCTANTSNSTTNNTDTTSGTTSATKTATKKRKLQLSTDVKYIYKDDGTFDFERNSPMVYNNAKNSMFWNLDPMKQCSSKPQDKDWYIHSITNLVIDFDNPYKYPNLVGILQDDQVVLKDDLFKINKACETWVRMSKIYTNTIKTTVVSTGVAVNNDINKDDDEDYIDV